MQYKTTNTSEILSRHVDTAVALINRLKKRNAQLETEHQILASENKRFKDDIEQYAVRISGYEEKLKSLESLLDEAQKEQSILEQSILSAITNLGTLEDNPTTLVIEETKSDIDIEEPYNNSVETEVDIEAVDTNDENENITIETIASHVAETETTNNDETSSIDEAIATQTSEDEKVNEEAQIEIF